MAETKDKLATLEQIKTLTDSLKSSSSNKEYNFTSAIQASASRNVAYYSFESQISSGGSVEGFDIVSAFGSSGRGLQVDSPCVFILTFTIGANAAYSAITQICINSVSVQTMITDRSNETFTVMIKMDTGDILSLAIQYCIIFSVKIAGV